MKRVVFFFYIMTITRPCFSQFKMTPEQQRTWDSIQQATKQDYKKMLQQLHIDSTRPGPSGNPQAPNAANSDESKVPAYTLPDPLILKSGDRVTDAKTWWQKRRPEIVEDFDKEIYGRVPENAAKVNWEVVSTTDTM